MEKVLWDQGSIYLEDYMGTTKDIINAARISFNKYINKVGKRDIKLLKFLVLNAHTSPLERAEFSFRVTCPIFIARQWHRHRSWSYSEISKRYTSDDTQFYIPHVFRKQSKDNKQASSGFFNLKDPLECSNNTDACTEMMLSANLTIDEYKRLLKKGVCKEQARMILPQSMMTTFIAKTDGNNLMKFVILRSDPHAQWEIQQYSNAIVKLTRPYIGEIWDILEEEMGMDFIGEQP